MHPDKPLGPLKIAATYAGTIIGAGFASGQEILQFFVSFGAAGLLGIAVAAILFAWLGGCLLDLGHRLKATAFHQAIYYLCGPRLGLVLDGAASLFLFGTLAIMLAGIAAIFRDQLGWPYPAGLALAAALVYLTVLRGVRGVAAANSLVTPLLLAVIVAVCLYSFAYHGFDPAALNTEATAARQPAPHWLLACLLYVSYNLMVGSTVLVPLGAAVPSRSARRRGGIMGGCLLGGLAAFLAVAVMLHHPAAQTAEIPLLAVADQQHPICSAAYSAILLAAMYTTALGTMFGCSSKLKAATGFHPAAGNLLVISLAAVCGQAGFANLVGLVFPVFGAATLCFTACLVRVSCRGG